MTQTSPYQMDLEQIIEQQKKYRQNNIKDVFSKSNYKISVIEEKMKKLFNNNNQTIDKNLIRDKNIKNQHKYQIKLNQQEIKQKYNTIEIKKNEKVNKNNKSTSSLKIFKKKNPTLNISPPKIQINQHKNHNNPQTLNTHHPISPNSALLTQSIFVSPQINSYISQQLQQLQIIEKLMQKNMKIKQLRVKDLEEEIEKLNQEKLNQYKKGQQIQKELWKINNGKNQKNFNKIKNTQQKENNQTHQFDNMKYQIDRLNREKQQLIQCFKQSKQILDGLERTNKQYKFEMTSTQRQLKRLIKSQKYQQRINQNVNQLNREQKCEEKQLYYQNSALKSKYKPNKLSSQRSAYCSTKKKPFQSNFKVQRMGSTDRLSRKKSKSTICHAPSFNLIQNRHSNNNCHHQKNDSNMMLYGMLSELDKLKSVINKEIGRSKNKGKIILSTFRNNQEKNNCNTLTLR